VSFFTQHPLNEKIKYQGSTHFVIFDNTVNICHLLIVLKKTNILLTENEMLADKMKYPYLFFKNVQQP